MTFPWIPLRYLTTDISRGSIPDYVDSGPIRVLNQACNQDTGFEWENSKYDSGASPAHSRRRFLENGDVVINSTGTGTLGRVGLFRSTPDQMPCIADTHVTKIRFDHSQMDPRFGYYFFSSENFQNFMLETLVSGSTNQIELNTDRLRRSLVPARPLPEQRRIADYLDAATSHIQSLQSLRRSQVLALTEREQAILDTYLLSDRDPLVALSRLCRVQTGIPLSGRGRYSDDVMPRPYLRVANVQNGELDLSTVKTMLVTPDVARRSTLLAGDVLLTEGGDIDKLGRGAVWSNEIPACLHQNHVFAIRPGERLDSNYLALLTRTSTIRSYFELTGNQTTNLASISRANLLALRVPLPAICEQRRRVTLANSALTRLRSLRKMLDNQVTLLSERRDSLINCLISEPI